MRSPSSTGKSFWVPERVRSTARESVSPGARVRKLVIMARPAGWRARPSSSGDGARLGAGADPDEDGDQEEDRVAHEAEDAEADGEALADAGGDPGGAHPVHAHGERGAQHPAAVHGEGGQEVEDGEHEVGGEERREEPAGEEVERAPARPVGGDDEVEERRRWRG